jgi:hypothetical protein
MKNIQQNLTYYEEKIEINDMMKRQNEHVKTNFDWNSDTMNKTGCEKQNEN